MGVSGRLIIIEMDTGGKIWMAGLIGNGFLGGVAWEGKTWQWKTNEGVNGLTFMQWIRVGKWLRKQLYYYTLIRFLLMLC